jgi:hypothetical protein
MQYNLPLITSPGLSSPMSRQSPAALTLSKTFVPWGAASPLHRDMGTSAIARAHILPTGDLPSCAGPERCAPFYFGARCIHVPSLWRGMGDLSLVALLLRSARCYPRRQDPVDPCMTWPDLMEGEEGGRGPTREWRRMANLAQNVSKHKNGLGLHNPPCTNRGWSGGCGRAWHSPIRASMLIQYTLCYDMLLSRSITPNPTRWLDDLRNLRPGDGTGLWGSGDAVVVHTYP